MGRCILVPRSGAENEALTCPSAVDGPRNRVILVGVAGPSGSGKTTLARAMVSALDSPVTPLGMDWYLEPKRMPRDPKFGKNWETPEAVDFDRLRKELSEMRATLEAATKVPEELVAGAQGPGCGNIIAKGHAGRPLGPDPIVVVIEGFLLFWDDKLCDMLDAHMWVEADCDTCLGRRHMRGKGSRKKAVEASAEWFKGLVWAHYEKNRRKQLANVPAALRLDTANTPKMDLLESVLRHCEELGAKRSATVTKEDAWNGRRKRSWTNSWSNGWTKGGDRWTKGADGWTNGSHRWTEDGDSTNTPDDTSDCAAWRGRSRSPKKRGDSRSQSARSRGAYGSRSRSGAAWSPSLWRRSPRSPAPRSPPLRKRTALSPSLRGSSLRNGMPRSPAPRSQGRERPRPPPAPLRIGRRADEARRRQRSLVKERSRRRRDVSLRVAR